MNRSILEKILSEGLTQREIASKLSVSQSTIKYWLKKYNLKTLNKQKPRITSKHKCSRCGETDPTKFYGKKRYTCAKCHNKETIERGRKLKRKAVDYLGSKCERCGYDKCIEALEFHHKDSNTKDSNFASKRGWSWQRLKKELNSCMLVCANCHREIHAWEQEVAGSNPAIPT